MEPEVSNRRPMLSQELIPYETAIKNFLGNWIWRAVHAMMAHPKFEPSPIWIASRLDISVEEAAEAIEGLLLLGLAKRTETGLKAEKLRVILPENFDNLSSYADNHTLLAQQLLARLNPSDREISFRSNFIASNSETFSEFFKQVCVLMDEFIEKSENLPNRNDIYCMTFEAVNALRTAMEDKKR